MKGQILVVDNYDSFTYNLVQYLGQCGANVLVRRNDEIELSEILDLSPTGIMLSPGPCTPKQSGICIPLLERYLSEGGFKNASGRVVPLFGVCLGHQAIGYVAGGVVKQSKHIMHGKASPVEHDGRGMFDGIPNPFCAIRYHSLIVTRDSVPSGFYATATALDDREIMGLRHESLPVEGVQFHPESVLTEHGIKIVRNFVVAVEQAE